MQVINPARSHQTKEKMKIIKIVKTGPESYKVVFKKWWSNKEFERHVIIDRFKIGEKRDQEHVLVTYRDSDQIAHDCRAHIEWMMRNDINYFNNFPELNEPTMTIEKR
jgi:hypothetical protein